MQLSLYAAGMQAGPNDEGGLGSVRRQTHGDGPYGMGRAFISWEHRCTL